MPKNSDLTSEKENKEKGKERVEKQTPTATGETAIKENAVRKPKGPDPTMMDKPTPKLRTKQKGKKRNTYLPENLSLIFLICIYRL